MSSDLPAAERSLALTGHADGRALERAARLPLDSAYRHFAAQHPRWAASLFDEHFLRRHAAGLLQRRIYEGQAVSPVALAHAWLDQLHWPVSLRPLDLDQLTSVAADFLRFLDEALEGSARPIDETPRSARPAVRVSTRAGDGDLGHVLTIYAAALRDGCNYELDWLWLASRLPQASDRRVCLVRALLINPNSELARLALRDLDRDA